MKYFGAEIDVVAAGQNMTCVCLRDLAAAAAIYAIDRDRALDWHAFKKLAAQTACVRCSPRRYLEPPPSHDTHRMDEVSAPLTGLSKKRSGRAVSIIVPSWRVRMP
jgi:hypothetical protein